MFNAVPNKFYRPLWNGKVWSVLEVGARIVSWDRDICIPKTTKNGGLVKVLSYPRKKYQANLGAIGLIGKLHLISDMSVDMVQEVQPVFKQAMNSNPYFPFTFLQSTGGGCKTRVILLWVDSPTSLKIS